MKNGTSYNNKYTDEQRERIKAMWLEGKSSGDICRHFDGMSRNAAIGLITRMNLPKRVRIRPPAKPRPVVPLIAELAPLPIGSPGEFSLKGCKWIAGEPTATFVECGISRKSGSPWCEYHHSRAFDRSRVTKSDGMNPSTGAARVFR